MLCGHCYGSVPGIFRGKVSIWPEKLAVVILLTALLSWSNGKSWGWRILDFAVFAFWWITFSSKEFTKAMTLQKGKNYFDRVLLREKLYQEWNAKMDQESFFFFFLIQHMCPVELNPWPCLPEIHKFIQLPTVCCISVSQFPGCGTALIQSTEFVSELCGLM